MDNSFSTECPICNSTDTASPDDPTLKENEIYCICFHCNHEWVQDEYPLCDICGSIIYRFDKTCMKCLFEDARKTIENSDKLLKQVKLEEILREKDVGDG